MNKVVTSHGWDGWPCLSKTKIRIEKRKIRNADLIATTNITADLVKGLNKTMIV
jgi:hypothetical protein